MKKALLTIASLFFILQGSAQPKETQYQKNHLFVQLNHHLEKRGNEGYECSNPDYVFSYERDLIGFGDHRFYLGARTGIYREYVLTGNGWDHPVRGRFFLGISPSYLWLCSEKISFQLSFLNDLLLPDDYDETWLYWAAEASFHYYIKDFILGISAARGVYNYFDPKAYMIKAGIKAGYRF